MGTMVSYELDGGTAAIGMDDGKVNALSPAMLAELGAALDEAEADRAAVLLTGREGVFSAGFDLNVLRAGGQEALGMIRAGFELALRLLSFPAPVIIACPGHAVAMGVFLLLSGDYRIGAAGPYQLRANEVALGLTMPHAAVEILRQRLTPACFNRALLLAEPFTPGNAVEAGFLDRVVDPGQLAGAAREAAGAARALNPEAFAASKLRAREQTLRAIRAGIDTDYAASRP